MIGQLTGNQTLDSGSIKLQNRQMIFRFLQDHPQVSRQDIVHGLKLSLPTVIANLDYLMEQGLVEQSAAVKPTGGRKASAYAIRSKARVAIGLYLTENHINAVAVDLAGEVICFTRKREPFDLDREAYLKELGNVVTEVEEKIRKAGAGALLGVGISLPGILSEDNETVINGATMQFTGKTKREIAKYIPCKCRLVHDSYASVFAETWRNDLEENAFYIGLNNYIGGAAVVRGQVYPGSNNKSGEIGHVQVVSENGKLCYCGNRGCFGTVCSAKVLSDLANGDLQLFFDRLANGDEASVQAWDTYVKHLARAINTIRLLFDCTVILGGYVGAHIGPYMEQLSRQCDQSGFFGDRAAGYLKQCKYTVEDAAVGAALLFIEDFIAHL